MKNFIAVRTKYYKKATGDSLRNHIYRVKNESYDFTKSRNVHQEFSKRNFNYIFNDIYELRAEYKSQTGKKPRKDFNETFEHLIIFSRERFLLLERYCKKNNISFENEIKKCINKYINSIKLKYGFEPIGYAFHLDEGYYDENDNFIINPHCHVEFFNYDFSKKTAPLKNIQMKVLVDGKRETNPAFSDFQDIGDLAFKRLGFKRGIKKTLTMSEHLKKDRYISNKRRQIEMTQKKHCHNMPQPKAYLLSELTKTINELANNERDFFKKLKEFVASGNAAQRRLISILIKLSESLKGDRVRKKNTNKKRVNHDTQNRRFNSRI